MPKTRVQKGETLKDYLKRCVPSEVKAFPPKQAVAVCASHFKKSKKK